MMAEDVVWICRYGEDVELGGPARYIKHLYDTYPWGGTTVLTEYKPGEDYLRFSVVKPDV